LKIAWQNNWIYYVLVSVIVIMPPFFWGSFEIGFLIEMLILALAATAANLMAGYTGMVSFGLAGFYGAAAYVTALLITKAGFPFEIAFFAGPIGAFILAMPIGWFCIKRTAVYFAMLTLAFSQLIYVVVYTWYSFTGGDNGIVGISIPRYLQSTSSYYYFTLVVVLICLIVLKILTNSPFGKTLNCIRDNPERAGFIGNDIRTFQFASFIISSFFLGVAGSLYCGFSASVFAEYANWHKTFEITTVYILGGMHEFLGPMGGAIIYLLLQKLISARTEYWPLFFGIAIILVTIFLPGGIFGTILERFSVFKEERKRKKYDIRG